MSRIWKEQHTAGWFRQHRYSDRGYPMFQGWEEQSPDSSLVPIYAYFVEVCGFTFKFGSIQQLRDTLEFYSQKVRPTSRLPRICYDASRGMDDDIHHRIQRWYDRLPGYLLKESKRQKVIKALQKAIDEFSADGQVRPNRKNGH